MRFLFLLAFLAGIFLTYIWLVRPQLRKLPVLTGVWVWIDAAEAKLCERSRVILLARLGMFGSALVGIWDYLLPYLTGIDFTPIVPEAGRPFLPLLIPVLVLIFNRLRWLTSGPVGAR